MKNKNIIILIIAIILCISIASASYACFNFGNSNDNSNINEDSNSNLNSNSISVSDVNSNSSADESESSVFDIGNIFSIAEPSLEIVNTTFSTGHTLKAKTYCTINVKAENVEDVIVTITYSRDGNKLASEKYKAIINEKGNIVLESKESFKKYPDKAVIKIYSTDKKLLNKVTVNLKTDDSTQVAKGNGTVTAESITVAQHSAATASSSYDSGAFYSEQSGRTIYTGEIQDGPDGHKWKHLGNNQWVKIN